MAIIILPHGEIQKLARDSGKSLPTVRKALRGQSKTKIAEMLRRAAMERGGVCYSEVEK